MSHSFVARKRFGQHFLEDQAVLAHMEQAVAAKTTDHLVEIGPGQAALTHYLIRHVNRYDAVEIDRDLVQFLTKEFHGQSQFHLHQGDALFFDFRSLLVNDEKLRVVGNLPYNISTPLLFHLFEQIEVISDMHFLLQKEVVDRLCAQPNHSLYGRLSVMAQYFCQAINLFSVGPEAFNPPPKVDSAFVRLVPHDPSSRPQVNVEHLSLIVREAFSLRRKTLSNSLKKIINGEQLNAIGIDPKRRAQELSVTEFVTISNWYSSNRR